MPETDSAQHLLKIWFPPLLLSFISLLGLEFKYLVFHTLAEFFSILVAATAMVVGTTSRTFTRNNYLIFVSVVIGWCAGIDLLHTLAFKGMNLLTDDNGNTGVQLWVVARFLQAIGFLVAPVFLTRPLNLWSVNLVIGAVVACSLWNIFSGHLPVLLAEGIGLTPLKIGAEYAIVAILLLALLHLYRKRTAASPDVIRYMSYAITAMVFSELAFTNYAAVDDRFNLLGHVVKIFAYWFIYIALVQKTLREPFDQLTRAASTYDAVADPTLIVDRAGLIVQANSAAAQLSGRTPQELVGCSSHVLFHQPDLSPAACPVCRQLKSTERGFVTQLNLGAAGAPQPTEFRCSVLPFPEEDPVFVEVIRDISQNLKIESLIELKLQSEARFKEIFEYSPTPMQISSVASGTMIRVNKAFTDWLGYDIGDLPTVNAWFDIAYADAAVRERVRQHWLESLTQAQATGGVMRSPELMLRTKDGKFRIASGSMTANQVEAIVTWVDLTEIRGAENAIKASEEHFRTMIEQSSAGMYIRRDGRFIYANPNFLKMLGYRWEEIENRDVHDFTNADPASLKNIHEAWAALDAGVESVTYTVDYRKKDGSYLTAELHAKLINWDGAKAHIVLVNDITEQTRQQQRIAAYTAQLERSMESTLEAISRMVEMRDPYTAGHERRVGLMARDIAIEMGWTEDRAEPLKMIGLVHDIGKIAVPSEILTKPSRLTELERLMVRTHVEAGYQILKDVDFPLPVAEIIRQHHERLDGSGYPQGLKGEEILPEARILAVADVVESMSTHRPYRAALGIEVAIDELERNRGTFYDGEVVDALIRLIRQKSYVIPA